MKRNRLTVIGLLIAAFCLTISAQAQWNYNGNHIYNTNTGNVGIGTLNPTDRLDVAGRIVSTNATNSNNRHLTFNGFYGYTWDFYGGHGGGGYFGISENQANPYFLIEAGTGKVGIGTTTPNKKLHVADGSTNITLGSGGTHPSNAALRIGTSSNVFSEIIFAPYESYFGDNVTLKGSVYGLAIQKVHPSARAALNIGFPDAAYGDGLFVNGTVGIGTTSPGSYKLAVNGPVRAKEFVVSTQGWPDFVFEENYRLTPLTELEQFVKTNKHLPGLPTARKVSANGVKLGDMQAKLLQKVEELTLYVIELKKENADLKKDISALKRQ